MAHDFSLIQVVLKGGWAIGLLFIMSIIVLGIIHNRWQFYRKNLKGRDDVWTALKPFLNKKNYSEALEAINRNPSFLTHIIQAGLEAKTEKNNVFEAMDREAKDQLLRFESRLPLLATIGSIAPFVGLFGTVLGIIRAFQDLALANAGGASVVSQGIAEALVSTAAGLFVAITAVFFYNLFQARLNEAAKEAEIVISDMNERLGQ